MALTWGGALIGDMNTVFQLVQAMFSSMGETWRQPKPDYRTVQAKTEEKSELSAASVKDDPYADDIHRLEDALNGGRPFEKGSCIEITLKDLLQIVERKRRRVDAYRGLVSRLNKMGVTLTITSNKTKLS